MVDGPLVPEDTTRGVTMPTIPAHVRTWIYGVAVATVPILIAYGVIGEQDAVLWVALVGALLGLGTATAYRPTRNTDTEQEG